MACQLFCKLQTLTRLALLSPKGKTFILSECLECYSNNFYKNTHGYIFGVFFFLNCSENHIS